MYIFVLIWNLNFEWLYGMGWVGFEKWPISIPVWWTKHSARLIFHKVFFDKALAFSNHPWTQTTSLMWWRHWLWRNVTLHHVCRSLTSVVARRSLDINSRRDHRSIFTIVVTSRDVCTQLRELSTIYLTVNCFVWYKSTLCYSEAEELDLQEISQHKAVFRTTSHVKAQPVIYMKVNCFVCRGVWCLVSCQIWGYLTIFDCSPDPCQTNWNTRWRRLIAKSVTLIYPKAYFLNNLRSGQWLD